MASLRGSLRQFILDRLEDRTDLEHRNRLGADIFLGDLKHGGKQTAAQDTALGRDGIGDADIFVPCEAGDLRVRARSCDS